MTCIVIGGHSPIGIAITKKLSHNSKIYHFSRDIDKDLIAAFHSNDNIELMKLPINDKINVIIPDLIDVVLGLNPSQIIFATRFRGNEKDYVAAYELEVVLPAELLNSYRIQKNESSLESVVFLGSPAGTKIVPDQNIYYHTNKASLEQVVRFFAVKLHGVRVNAVLPGGFVAKERSQEFYNTHTEFRNAIESFIPTRNFIQLDDIANVVSFLISDSSKQVNGQMISVDGGYRNWEESAHLISLFRK